MVNGDEDSVDKEGDNNNDDSDNGVNATILTLSSSSSIMPNKTSWDYADIQISLINTVTS